METYRQGNSRNFILTRHFYFLKYKRNKVEQL